MKISEKSTNSFVSSHLDSVQAYRGFAAVFVLFFHIDMAAELKWGMNFLGGAFKFGYCGISFFLS